MLLARSGEWKRDGIPNPLPEDQSPSSWEDQRYHEHEMYLYIYLFIFRFRCLLMSSHVILRIRPLEFRSEGELTVRLASRDNSQRAVT